MEHKPMKGAEPLDPPSPEIAQLYLDEAQQVEQRRVDRVDRRAGAWRSIIGAVELAVAFTAYVLVMRVGDVPFPLLILILVIGQISAGYAERHGVQWRVRGWYWVVVGVFTLAFLVTIIWLLASPLDRPFWMFLIPGGLLLIGGVWNAAAQLWKARGTPRAGGSPQEPTPNATRIATAVLGAVLGVCAVLISLGDDQIASIVMVVPMLGVVVWLWTWTTDFGPRALGRYWSWVQEAAFCLGMAIVVALSLLRAYTDVVTPALGVAGGAVAALALAGSAVFGRHD